MDSSRRQRSIAPNHIPPLPIPHGLEYARGTRMHLCVVHLRPEARGRPFPRSPRSRSRLKPRVLRPLTRKLQGQPSPLRTLHGRPGVQGIVPTSRGQAPHGWPMVHHSMATDFPIPRGCCSVFSASPRPLVRNPATSRSPVPRPVTHHVLLPASRAFPFSRGCHAAIATRLPRTRPIFPSSGAYTPPGRQQPCGAGPLDLHPSEDHFVRLARVAPFLPPFVRVVCFFLDLLVVHIPGPAPASRGTRAHFPAGHLQLLFFFSRFSQPLFCTVCSFPYPRCLLALCFTPSGSALWFFLGLPPPPFSAVHPALWFPALAAVVGLFFLLSSLHARTSALH